MARLTVAVAFLAVTGCGLPVFGQGHGCDTVRIDWVDFVQVGSTQYVAGREDPGTLKESDLGPVVTHVKFKVDGNVCDPQYKPKDGDAAFLDPGTPIYQVSGRAASQALAARRNGQILIYTVLAS